MGSNVCLLCHLTVKLFTSHSFLLKREKLSSNHKIKKNWWEKRTSLLLLLHPIHKAWGKRDPLLSSHEFDFDGHSFCLMITLPIYVYINNELGFIFIALILFCIFLPNKTIGSPLIFQWVKLWHVKLDFLINHIQMKWNKLKIMISLFKF